MTEQQSSPTAPDPQGGEPMSDVADALTSRAESVESRAEQLAEALTNAKAQLETIVCTVGPDAGVVLLSNEGPTHYDAEHKCQVYDHDYFSPLGDALIALHKMLARPATTTDEKGA